MSSDNLTQTGRGGRGRGRGGGRGDGRGTTKPMKIKEAVPILRFGQTNNWIEFKKKMALAAEEHYGDLGRIVNDEAYYVPPLIDPNLFGSTDPLIDTDGVNKATLLEANKDRIRAISKMQTDRASLYSFILSKISRESEDELKAHAKYPTLSSSLDPLTVLDHAQGPTPRDDHFKEEIYYSCLGD